MSNLSPGAHFVLETALRDMLYEEAFAADPDPDIIAGFRELIDTLQTFDFIEWDYNYLMQRALDYNGA